MYYKSLINQIDKILAVIGLILSLILVIFLHSNPLYALVGTLIFLSCLLWIIMKKKELNDTKLEDSHFYLLLSILFVIFYLFSILALYFRPEIYSRPTSYFVFTSAMISVIFLEILVIPKQKKFLYLTLIQIIIAGISISFSPELIFNYVVGVDPWYHQMFTSSIIELGHIPGGSNYSFLPLFHIGVAFTQLICSLNYIYSSLLFIQFSKVVVIVLIVYLLGKKLFFEKIGLLSSLLVIIAVDFVGVTSIPNLMGIILIMTIFYLLFNQKNVNNVNNIILIIMLMVSLVLTHSIASVFMAIILFAYWFSISFYNYIYSKDIYSKGRKEITLGMPIFFSVIMISWWTYASKSTWIALGNILSWGFSIDRYGMNPVISINQIPAFEVIYNNLPGFLFISLSLIGLFYMLSKYRDRVKFSYAATALIILAIPFLSLVTGLSILQERWWIMLEIFLSIPLAAGIYLLLSNLNKMSNRKLLICCSFILFIFSFISLTSLGAMNNDYYNICPNSIVREAFFDSEIQPLETMSKFYDGGIGGDYSYSSTVMRFSGYNFCIIDNELLNKNFSDLNDSLVLIRNEIVNRPFSLDASTYKLNYNPKDVLDNERFNKVYDSGTVSGYI